MYSLQWLIVPTLLREEELYTQMGFTDRYIYRRELGLVSLESSSSVENGIKKIFLFCFLQGVIQVYTSEKIRVNSVVFIHIFQYFRQFC